MPIRICLTEMFAFQSSSSFRMERHTVPLGYTFGWGSTGLNWPTLCAVCAVCTFRGLHGVVVREVHEQRVDPTLPDTLRVSQLSYPLWPGDLALPLEHLGGPVLAGGRLGHETLHALHIGVTNGWSARQFLRSALRRVRARSLTSLDIFFAQKKKEF